MVKKDVTTASRGALIIQLQKAQTFKDKNSILKALRNFDPCPKFDEVDNNVETSDIVLKKYSQPQSFVCFRCDIPKMSNMKAKWQLTGNPVRNICGACFDHVTRCVIAYRGVPEHHLRTKCMHHIPKSYKRQNTLE
eukprot:GHVL01039366.1.p1 GENE.GHVL01039366.1~~GHVL01039366.1.p1  ORF type:complete len:151 (+),score=16.32 GHVL01039366.1:46-453(+)